jgi:hypothetical protein
MTITMNTDEKGKRKELESRIDTNTNRAVQARQPVATDSHWKRRSLSISPCITVHPRLSFLCIAEKNAASDERRWTVKKATQRDSTGSGVCARSAAFGRTAWVVG